ncbi:MAG: DksA/TraR family C4-type zinc finger protein [Cellvibrionales bacterium]|nr:DksA/TraR family C4-type zinc finger protein [Cellvibrionales bacterium]
MATGWAHEGAVQEQIDATINDAVQSARTALPQGKSLTHCEECEKPIPVARQQAIVGVRYCVQCQELLEQEQQALELFNRRGSKDSQLR